eukprot:403347767
MINKMNSNSEIFQCSFRQVHDYILYEILQFCDVQTVVAFTQTDKHFNQAIKLRNEGKNFIRSLILRELGLIQDFLLEKDAFQNNIVSESFYNNLDNCKAVYEKSLKRWNPRISRFFGFRTTGGVDHNDISYSVSNLFNPNGMYFAYCSDISPNIDVTGVYVNENINDQIIKINKFMMFFYNIDVKSFKQKSNKKNMIASFNEGMLNIIRLNENYLSNFYDRFGKSFSENFYYKMAERLNQDKMLKMKSDFPHYFELENQNAVKETENTYLLFDRVEISRKGDFTCPVKSLVIFAHNQDINIKDNETLNLLNNCKDFEDVTRLRQNHPDIIPPLLTRYNENDSGLGMINEVAMFDQSFYQQQNKQLKETSQLNQKIATRFITVKLIETDNRMQEMGDQHLIPNFDVRNILFYGERIPSHLATELF